MRIPLLSFFTTSPFEALQEHADRIKECSEVFQQAIECHINHECKKFEELRDLIGKYEGAADSIKRKIRSHLPVGTFMPVDKFQLFRYLREQDHVMDSFKKSIQWISYREEPGIPEEYQKEFLLLMESVVNPVEELSHMVAEARQYFKSYSEKRRAVVKEIIRTIRKQEQEADRAEDIVKKKVLTTEKDAVTVFHMIRLAEAMGSIADHAENAADMMRAMIAR